MTPSDGSVAITVRGAADRHVGSLLALQTLAGRTLALAPLLRAMCEEGANLLAAEVVSVYLREPGPRGDDRLVLTANVGFPESAVGHVVLAMGEGITGFAAECLRPVSTADAARDARFKPVSGLGEERFPAFLAVPFLVEGRAAGVLVAQRRAAEAFDDGDLLRATAAAGAVAHAVDRARLRAGVGGPPAPRPVRLDGVPHGAGMALGVAVMLGTWDALARHLAERPPPSPVDVASALDALRAELRRGLGKVPPGAVGERLRTASLALDDERVRDRAIEKCAAHGAVEGLREVAREYALAPLRAEDAATSAWLLDRAREVEDFCQLVAARLAGAPLPGQGAVLVVPDRLGLWVAVLALGRGAGGFAVGGPVADDDPAVELVRAAGRPLLAEVAGLYGWVRPGDRVLVDADRGWLRVHPAFADVARERHARRR